MTIVINSSPWNINWWVWCSADFAHWTCLTENEKNHKHINKFFIEFSFLLAYKTGYFLLHFIKCIVIIIFTYVQRTFFGFFCLFVCFDDWVVLFINARSDAKRIFLFLHFFPIGVTFLFIYPFYKHLRVSW